MPLRRPFPAGQVAFENENAYHSEILPSARSPVTTFSAMPRAFGAFPLLVASFAVTVAASAFADDDEYRLVIQDHRFQPNEISVPVGKRVRLVVENRDATPEEFESHALNREKVIAGKSTATVHIGPLQPGRYPFIGEYHEDTAKGVVIAQ